MYGRRKRCLLRPTLHIPILPHLPLQKLEVRRAIRDVVDVSLRPHQKGALRYIIINIISMKH